MYDSSDRRDVSTDADDGQQPPSDTAGGGVFIERLLDEHSAWREKFTHYYNDLETRVEATEKRQERDEALRGHWPMRGVIAGLTAAGSVVMLYHTLVVAPMQDMISEAWTPQAEAATEDPPEPDAEK